MFEDVNPTEVEVTSARLLEMIESAYPNPLSVTEMAKYGYTIYLLVARLDLIDNNFFQTNTQRKGQSNFATGRTSRKRYGKNRWR